RGCRPAQELSDYRAHQAATPLRCVQRLQSSAAWRARYKSGRFHVRPSDAFGAEPSPQRGVRCALDVLRGNALRHTSASPADYTRSVPERTATDIADTARLERR